jgi:undecaprenyl-diphosphatase
VASGLNIQSKRFPEGSQGPNPKTCLLVFGIALVVFLLIAAAVVNAGGLTLLDARINVGLHSNTRPGLIEFFIWVSKLHSNWSTTIVTGAIAVYLWIKRLHYWILILAISVWGGVLLNVILKLLFARPRAHFDSPILTLPTFSFPSGHTMLATVFYGSLCVFTFRRTRSQPVRGLVMLLTVLMIALVGFSRMYLGVHYLTDVLGAIAEGVAWISFSLLLVTTLRRQRN